MQIDAPCTTGKLHVSQSSLTLSQVYQKYLGDRSCNLQAVCLAACKKLHEMGAFTDMLLPDKGMGGDADKVEQNEDGDPLPGTARHREFYPEGVADILQVSSSIFPSFTCNCFMLLKDDALDMASRLVLNL